MKKIKRNAIRCRHCGHVMESTHRHDFRQHYCESAGPISREYDHDLRAYVPAVPYMMVDGGLDYVRCGGDPKDYELLTEYEE